jgi:hypothetical protein
MERNWIDRCLGRNGRRKLDTKKKKAGVTEEMRKRIKTEQMRGAIKKK